jgi:hypothetical protein
VLAAARGFLSGRRFGQNPSPSIPVPPSTGDGSNSVNPLLPERVSASSLHLSSAAEHSNRYVVNWLADGPITPIHLPLRLYRIDLNHQAIQMETRANLTQPPAIIMPRPPPYSAIDKAMVIEWLHYPLGYSDGKDHSKIIISKR